MNIGKPTNVRHVAHVTFDRFSGFLGLPDEFEPEVPRKPPSASATVFGVSTESMQLSYDSRGNSVPTILLLMQRHLYAQGGLQVEGIFRINPDNSQEEHLREQLNLGLVPEDIDVHSLAGLIKAWFRELPTGVLDSLSQEQVMQCQTEDECIELVRRLPHTEATLLDWAINLMADVVQHEDLNKMNARNIAMVFAPNMTQMADPFSALMYVVQVMNFLKTLILRTLRERKDSVVEPNPRLYLEPSNENGHHTLSESFQQDTAAEHKEAQESFVSEKSFLECSPEPLPNISSTGGESSSENPVCNEELYCEFPPKKGKMGKNKTSGSNARIRHHHSLSESCQQDTAAAYKEAQESFVSEKSFLECSPEPLPNISSTGGESSSENPICNEELYCEFPPKKGKMGKNKTSGSNARIKYHHSLSESCLQDTAAEYKEAQEKFVSEKSFSECSPEPLPNISTGGEPSSLISSSENPICNEELYCEFPPKKGKMGKNKTSGSNAKKGTKKTRSQQQPKGMKTLNNTDTRYERIEAWR